MSTSNSWAVASSATMVLLTIRCQGLRHPSGLGDDPVGIVAVMPGFYLSRTGPLPSTSRAAARHVVRGRPPGSGP
ncbi:hypothetical protein ACFFX0_05985 [Citricoccus parietis]|uniref:Uncharacterized protein n=1 Tax=Citricoccus parietis TaxID=592307 RepID=A0ABV5FVR8_9MICC